MRPETETLELSADNAAVPTPSHGTQHALEARVDALEQETEPHGNRFAGY